jgi:hypothetical protein
MSWALDDAAAPQHAGRLDGAGFGPGELASPQPISCDQTAEAGTYLAGCARASREAGVL